MEHKEAPCRECTLDTGRKPGCHGNCQEYKEWKAYLDKKKQAVNKMREEDFWFMQHRAQLAKKFKNQKKWRRRKYD